MGADIEINNENRIPNDDSLQEHKQTSKNCYAKKFSTNNHFNRLSGQKFT